MNYAKIERIDSANGPGVRVSLFVQGCTKQCYNCFNPETWDFCDGKPYTQEIEDTLIEWMKPTYIKGITLLGGDPTEPQNVEPILPLMRRVKKLYPDKTIWIYSGDTLDKLNNRAKNEPELKEMLDMCDVLVDGPYVDKLRNLKLRHRGSENQRVIDMNETRKIGEIVLLKGWEDIPR